MQHRLPCSNRPEPVDRPAPSDPLITVENLTVSFSATPAVQGISFSVHAGECLALVGESGSGKSVTARSLMGLSGGTVHADTLEIFGADARAYGERDWRALRGNQIAMILQDALSALDPLRPIGREIDDVLRRHGWLDRTTRRDRVLQALEAVKMPDPDRRARQYSHQLSGGMRQRVLIAQALIGNPEVVIADEATTALDAPLTAVVLDQLATMRDQGRAVLMISHDLAQVVRVADRIAVMRHGEIVETGTTETMLTACEHDYTKTLLKAMPRGVPRHQPLSPTTVEPSRPKQPADRPELSSATTTQQQSCPVLVVDGLSKSFGSLTAVDGVSFSLNRGTTLGIVGESGSGKTTTARLILGLEEPDAGTVRLGQTQFTPATESDRRAHRERLGAIYQNPLASFDPRYSVENILVDALSRGRHRRGARYRDQVTDLLNRVRLAPSLASRNPAQLSGGQRQRLAIARALATSPEVLVLDEPVSALDVSIQATILDLLDEIQRARGTSMVLISHDLGVIEHMSDQVAVMYRGRCVEQGATSDIFAAPRDPYTQQLLTAVPELQIDRSRL
ncbi:dipeptide ABC transporter ATP-binding protein [Auritidibacter ignavus]|uniref:dipeptide ABC transporter ATP-binding protein n=1 Tax=Auritidibacter ignavus TaxID=678932 RepID=UPI000F041237|nr:ABC transporter ATP-binding protein [Auritidibacter ignavus]NIH70662.1 peptide/nickel transport system ATP-binding protein [Auritidibacter ignavus]RMX23210.1 ABC transporter ATP-binding protein [Auritidibacter ignavus]